MRYVTFGRSGPRVSELCLGTYTFGNNEPTFKNSNYITTDYAENKAIFDCFADAGGNFIDTSDFYTGGSSEKMIGEFVRSDRDYFVIGTKYSCFESDGSLFIDNGRKNMMRSVERSLSRLNTDYIDLYWLHVRDAFTPIDEILRGFDDLVSSGKVLYVGVCNMPAWEVGRADLLAELRGWAPLAGIQIPFSLVNRFAECELLPLAAELGLGVAAFGLLGNGVLSGKYLDRPVTADYARVNNSPEFRDIVETVLDIARQTGHSPSQVAIAAISRKHPALVPILGARTLAQLQDNIRCLEVALEDEHLRRIEEAVQCCPSARLWAARSEVVESTVAVKTRNAAARAR